MNLSTPPAYPLLSKKPLTRSVATATLAVDQTESTSFSLPGRAQLFMLFNPFTACRLTSQTVSFRSPLYHLPRLFTGFSETVGMASPLMKNALSTTFPLTIEMLLDLEGLNYIRAHSI